MLLMVCSSACAHKSITVSNLGVDRGLSCDFVSAMAQDKLGFIWVATEEGLNRFDGLGFFTVYKNTTGTGLTGNELNCLLDDSTGPIMWIGTQRSGLNAYNYATGQITYYRHDKNDPQSLSTDDITDLCLAADGNIWVATYWGGINLLNKATGKCTHYGKGNVSGLPDNSVWGIADNGKGRLYVGHVRNGLSVIDVKRRRAVNYRHDPANPLSISGNDVRCIYRDRSDRIWVGTERGLDMFDPDTGRFLHLTDNGRLARRIFDISELSDGCLWVATELGGVAVIDCYTLNITPDGMLHAPVEYITKGYGDNHISGNSVRCLIEDNYGNVWMGLYGDGVDFITFRSPLFNSVKYSPFDTPTRLTNKSVMGLCLDDRGYIYAGTDGDGVNIFSPDKQRVGTIATGANGSVQAATRDSQGRLWFGGFFDGAYVYAGGTASRVEAIGATEDVRTFREDSGGNMWIGTSRGIYIISPDGKRLLKHYDVPGNLVRSIAFDTAGRIWVGTFGNGLMVYSPAMKKEKDFHTDNGFPSNTVNQVMRDGKGGMWVCTAEGLVHFNSPRTFGYNVYGKGNNLDNINIRAVAEDKDGNIWASTNKGISCKRKGSDSFLNWDYTDNIPLGNFISQSVATGRDGMMYFGSNNGLCYFNPQSVLERRMSPPPVITRLSVSKQGGGRDSVMSVIGTKSISLDYRQNTFTVGFSPSDFSLHDEVEFAYKLESMQEEWVTTRQNDVTFHNLSPGKYKLLVRCRLHNQPWCDKTAAITIIVEPPFWLTWWAKLFYIACAGVAVWLMVRFYSRNIHLRYLYEADKKNLDNEMKLNNERMRFYTNITHELRTPLTLIISPLEDILGDTSLPAGIRKSIELVRNSAVRLNDLVDKILEFRKTDTGNRNLIVGRANIVAVIREMCAKYSELNRNGNVKIVFKASQEIINVYFDREVINIIIDNLVSNAIKYTEKGQITISVSLEEGKGTGDKGRKRTLEIAVADTGYGISAEALPHIFERYYQEHGPHQASGTGIGLALVKNVVQLHEGTIDVESKPGEGSIFRVRLDADNTYDTSPHSDADTVTAKPGGGNGADAADDGDAKQKIMLIVEDNRDICQYIADSFSGEFRIITAENGRDGLKAAFKYIPDIIISDIMMPYMSGTEMCRKLKTDMRTNHIPIILLTAKSSTFSKEEGYESGADSFITKPFVRSLIALRVANLLRQRELLARSYDVSGNDGNSDMRNKRAILRDAMDKADREFLNSIDEHIKERIHTDIDIDYLAECMNISASTLYRKMKALTGLSANEYIRKYKMTYAEKLLLEGRFTIKEVGYMVGMSTASYFRKCFKDEFGETPSEYLKRVKSDSAATTHRGGGKLSPTIGVYKACGDFRHAGFFMAA